MEVLHQTECNSNHKSIRRNTLIELKSLPISSYYKLIKYYKSSKQQGKYQYQTKECSQHNSILKVSMNNYYQHIIVRYISHDCKFENMNQLIFFFGFLHCCEKVHDNKVKKIKDLVLNDESRHIKLNSTVVISACQYYKIMFSKHSLILLKYKWY